MVSSVETIPATKFVLDPFFPLAALAPEGGGEHACKENSGLVNTPPESKER